jgi:hypothetical protein
MDWDRISPRHHIGTREVLKRLKPRHGFEIKGLPVHPDVLNPKKSSQLSPKSYNITVSGGGLGLDVVPMTEEVLRGRLPRNAKVHSVAGRDEKIFAKLKEMSRRDRRLRPHGFAPLPSMMADADLNVIRSHGTTFAESVAAGKPAVYFAPSAKRLTDYQGQLTRDTARYGHRTVGHPAAVGLENLEPAVSKAITNRRRLKRRAKEAKERMGNPSEEAVKYIMKTGEEKKKVKSHRKLRGQEVWLDRRVPMLKRPPKTSKRLVQRIERVLAGQEHDPEKGIIGFKNIAFPVSALPEPEKAGFKKTRIAVPLPGESIGTPSWRRGELHMHKKEPYYVIHRDVTAPTRGPFEAVKHWFTEGVPATIRRFTTERSHPHVILHAAPASLQLSPEKRKEFFKQVAAARMNHEKRAEEKEVYHGSPRKLKVLVPMNAHSTKAGKVVFSTPHKSFATAYAGRKWGDRELGQGMYDGEMRLIEMRPKAFEKTFKGKKGYLYTMKGGKHWKPLEGGSRMELVTPKAQTPTKAERIHAYDLLKADPNVKVLPFDPKSKEFMREIGIRKGIIKKMSPKEREEYLRWYLEGADPAVAKHMKTAGADRTERCFRIAGRMAADNPSLKLMKGPPIFKEDTAHFWVENKKGKVIDPTAKQFPMRGYKYQGTPVDIRKNLSHLRKLEKTAQMQMPFPGQYRESLQRGIKSSTVRVGAEMGKYVKGGVYQATNYKGQPYGVSVKVHSIEKMPMSALDAATRKGTTGMISRKFGMSPADPVEVIRFEVQRG